MSESNEKPSKPSSYSRFTVAELLRKLDVHLSFIASIERELKRRVEAGHRDAQ